MKKKIAEDEIDMVELIITIWKNKWKIILVTMLAIIITYGFQFNQQPAKSAFSTIQILSLFQPLMNLSMKFTIVF